MTAPTPAPPAVDIDGLAAVARLTERVRVLEAELAAAREKNFELKVARDFADTATAGYVDRTGLDTP